LISPQEFFVRKSSIFASALKTGLGEGERARTGREHGSRAIHLNLGP
jgi:hypothetical protein